MHGAPSLMRSQLVWSISTGNCTYKLKLGQVNHIEIYLFQNDVGSLGSPEQLKDYEIST